MYKFLARQPLCHKKDTKDVNFISFAYFSFALVFFLD